MSVTSSQRSAEEEEDFEESVTDSTTIDPVISFFSRQPTKKSFPSYPPNADPYDEDLVSIILYLSFKSALLFST